MLASNHIPLPRLLFRRLQHSVRTYEQGKNDAQNRYESETREAASSWSRELVSFREDASFGAKLWNGLALAGGVGCASLLYVVGVRLLTTVPLLSCWGLLIVAGPLVLGLALYFWIVARRNTEVTRRKRARLAKAQAEYAGALERLNHIWQKALAELQRDFAAYQQPFEQETENAFLGLAWTDPRWQQWRPCRASLPLTRLGTLTTQQPYDLPSLPAFCVPLGGRNILFEGPSYTKNTTYGVVQALVCRLLATQPPGKVRFAFIDPEKIGQHAAAFMDLRDHNPELVTEKIWVEPSDIEQQLRDLTDHIEYINRMYLRGGYYSLEEYHAAVGEIVEPYRVLVVWDFPVNFTKETTERLINIAVNGPRCGVSTIVIYDVDVPLPVGLDGIDDRGTGQVLGNWRTGRLAPGQLPLTRFARWEGAADVFAWNGTRFLWQDPDFGAASLEFDPSPSPCLFQQILEQVGEASKSSSGVRLPFERIALAKDQWWQGDSREGISVPIGRPFTGRTDGVKPQVFTLDYDKPAQHAFVGGTTGSGKSILLRVLIASLALKYSPDEVKLYVIDLKDVSFLPFVNHMLPHIRTIAINSDREYVLSILKEIDREFEARKKLFKQVGLEHNLNIEKVSHYRRALPKQKLPRVLLIIDELQELFAQEDEIANQALTLLTKFAKGGRSFGIHVILASQTLAGESMRRVEREFVHQVGLRIAMKCTDDDSRRILGSDNPAAKDLTGKGHGIYNTELGAQAGNIEFQGAMFAEEDSIYLEAVRQLAQEWKYTPSEKQLIFNGFELASVAQNDLLKHVVFCSAWLHTPGNRATVWLGDPIDITTPTAVSFKRESRCNLLLLGLQQGYASGIFVTSLLTLAAQYAPEAARFYVLDFSGENAFRNLLARDVGQPAPHKVQVVKRPDVPALIAEIYQEIDERDERDDGEEQTADPSPSLYLFIYGLPRERELNQDMPGESSASLADRLSAVLQEGPHLGVHTLLWCDRLASLKERLGSWALDAFDKKVLFQMTGEDVRDVVGERVVPPEQDRALFHSDDEARLEKFRPYPVPSAEWLRQAVEAIARKR